MQPKPGFGIRSGSQSGSSPNQAQDCSSLLRPGHPPPSSEYCSLLSTLTSPVTKYLPSGEKARAVMVFLQEMRQAQRGTGSPAPSQSPQKARPADTNGTCVISLAGPGAQSQSPEPQRPQTLLTDPRRCSLRAQTHLPGTVEDVVLFVFPGIEQHDHTPGEMSETTDFSTKPQLPQELQAPRPGSWGEPAQGGSTCH